MTMFQGSMYVRVKREKITYFIQADPSDTILELKEKLQEHLDKLPEEQRLLKDDTPLEDAKSLAEYRIENDDVLALTYKLPGKCRRNCSRLPEERSFVLLFLIFRVFLKSTILLTATD